MAAAPMALAQNAAMTPSTTITANRVEPGQLRATDIKGSNVYDGQNNKVGSIRDIILDRSGRVAAVVIDADGRNVAVAMQDLHFTMNDNNQPKTITIDKSLNELKSVEVYHLNTTSNSSSGSSTAPADRSR
jgi:hypothetical protein